MAINDILTPEGDTQDFVIEIPVGNALYVPEDILIGAGGVSLCVEIPVTEGGGGDTIFIMSE